MGRFIFAGASSAMARETAKQLILKGHEVVGLSRQSSLDEYTANLQVTDYLSHYPPLEGEWHGLVYFPGSINLKNFARISNEEYESDFSIHCLGAVNFVKAYYKQIKSGSIVFISSVAATTGMPFHTSVAMSKGALEGLTRALAAELAPAIRVNALALSLTDTPMAQRLLSTPEKTEQLKQRNPLKHIGTPADVCNSLEFFLTEQSSWISGTILELDGGMKNLRL